MRQSETMLDTKDRILNAACELYLLEGPKGFSMRKVATRTGITPTAIYRHFDAKESLYQQVLRQGFRTFASYLFPALKGADPLERLYQSADGFFRFATEQSRFYELLFLSTDAPDEATVHALLRQEAGTTYQFMIERVRECMQAGQLKQDDPEEIAMLLLSVCNGFFGLYASKKFKSSLPEMRAKYDRMLERILAGIKTA